MYPGYGYVTNDRIFVIIAIAALFGIVIGLSLGYLITRRRKGNMFPDRGLVQIDGRLTLMEQAIDAIAIEVERVSEGQRFTTKLLSQRSTQSVG